jgi:hypothetical protein
VNTVTVGVHRGRGEPGVPCNCKLLKGLGSHGLRWITCQTQCHNQIPNVLNHKTTWFNSPMECLQYAALQSPNELLVKQNQCLTANKSDAIFNTNLHTSPSRSTDSRSEPTDISITVFWNVTPCMLRRDTNNEREQRATRSL